MLELVLTTKRLESIIEILDDAGMFDTYDPLLRHIVARSAAAVGGGCRHRFSFYSSHALPPTVSHCHVHIGVVESECVAEEGSGVLD
jgi:hypothetical protein